LEGVADPGEVDGADHEDDGRGAHDEHEGEEEAAEACLAAEVGHVGEAGGIAEKWNHVAPLRSLSEFIGRRCGGVKLQFVRSRAVGKVLRYA
jgi:hypothetical protein